MLLGTRRGQIISYKLILIDQTRTFGAVSINPEMEYKERADAASIEGLKRRARKHAEGVGGTFAFCSRRHNAQTRGNDSALKKRARIPGRNKNARCVVPGWRTHRESETEDLRARPTSLSDFIQKSSGPKPGLFYF